LPIVMFENMRAHAALLDSRNRTHGILWRIGLVLLGWIISGVLTGLALLAGYRVLANLVMGQPTQFPVIRILLLLMLQGAILGAISFVTVVGQGLLTRRLYLDRNHQLSLPCHKVWDSAPPSAAIDSIWVRRFVLLLLAVVVVAPVALWADLPQYLKEPKPVEITAHRGHSRAAPENTLAALQAAIDSGADYSEIDVQLTADGEVVLLHDRDFRRLARDSRQLAEVTLAELQEIDVGSWFDPKFADERVPTLQQAIDLCYGKMKLNIELKYYGTEPDVAPLVEATTEVVRRNGFEDQSLITSLRYPACEEVRRIKPNFRTGLIVTHALGDISRVDVDALVVRADFLSERLLFAARRLDREVHVWTLNDPRQIRRFINRGVDNIMTSDPDLGIRTRDEWIEMDATQRAIVAARVLLGLRN
ncbi:MAG: glycerophosphodiester phosphodiesterase family protein, partial [Pirellulaceae bacterium]